MTATTAVIDASVAVKWVLPEPDTPQALAAYRLYDLEAPWLLLPEVSNALWKHGRKGVVDAATAEQMAVGLPRWVRLSVDSNLHAEALALANMHNHPVYDMIYVSLSRKRRIPLLTADLRLERLCRDHDLTQTIGLASIPLSD